MEGTCDVRKRTCDVRKRTCDVRKCTCDGRKCTCEVRKCTCDVRKCTCVGWNFDVEKGCSQGQKNERRVLVQKNEGRQLQKTAVQKVPGSKVAPFLLGWGMVFSV